MALHVFNTKVCMSTPVTKFRKHQRDAREFVDLILADIRKSKITVAGITPGGGKTLMASLFANKLADAEWIEQVLVVVPNDSLRQQFVESFHAPGLGLDRYLKAPCSQVPMPGMGRPFGSCITYQLLTNEREAKRFAKVVASKPTLVIFDECHHLSDPECGKAWERGARKLVDAAKHTLCMSGTLWRWDEERIPFIEYDENNVAKVDIRYSRAEALEEQAVLPFDFKFVDGGVVYEHHRAPHETALSTATTKESSRALKTALLSNEYAEQFVVTALREWAQYRETSGHRSSAIVVCHSQEAAKRAMRVCSKHFTRFMPALALSSEPGSDRAIKHFRLGVNSILVTVRKAYEGLDVPGATHLVYLGDSRSWPFLDQVFARVARFDRASSLEWSEQIGHIFVPADSKMREYVANMLNEQAPYFREKEHSAGAAAHGKHSSFRPDSAEVTAIGAGIDGRVFTVDENRALAELDARYSTARLMKTRERIALAYDLGLVKEISDAAE
jgi:superfamily II DNA or RNA helicase